MAEITAGQLEQITEAFEISFPAAGRGGAALSLWQHGREILHCCAGMADPTTQRPWTPDTLVPVWSASKGPAVLCVLMALKQAGIGLETAVAEVWPEFAQQGKGRITLAHLLSHRAGLSALDREVSIHDRAAVIAALEQQAPLWSPGCQQGYHPRTFGFLLEALMQRLTGAESLGAWMAESLTKPIGADFWLGLPASCDERVARVFPGRLTLEKQGNAFFKAFLSSGSLTQRSFHSPRGLHAVNDFNRAETWRAGFASMGGVCSARGLALIYSVLANSGQWQGRQWISPEVLSALCSPLSQKLDLVLQEEIAFSAGMMMDPVEIGSGLERKRRSLFGPGLRAFGHPGAGGSLAFADPDQGLAFAIVLNELEPGALPPEPVLRLARLAGGSMPAPRDS